MRALSVVVASGLALAVSSSAIAEVSVAVAPVSGPKKTGSAKLGQVVRSKLAQAGLQVISERTLAVAAMKAGASPSTPKAAEEAGADLLVAVSIKKAAKKFVASGKLIEVRTGRVLKTAQASYKKGASANAGAAIGGELAAAAASFKPTPDANAESSGPTAKSQAIVSPKDEEEAEAPAKRAAPSVIPKDEVKGAATSVQPASAGASGERRVIRLSLGLASQIATAYTVTVGSQSTGLAYKLNPLFGVVAGGRVTLPSLGLSLDLGLSYVRVTYTVDITPPVTPLKPSGRYLDFGAVLAYDLTLSRFGPQEERRLILAPLAGLVYRSLSVERTAPETIVISSSALAPRFGARLGLLLGSVALEASGAADLVVAYNEEPEKTGNNGRGLGLAFGIAGRYWISDMFGLSLNLGYDWMRISMSGNGTRRTFMNDPPLVNATVHNGDLRAGFGALLAL